MFHRSRYEVRDRNHVLLREWIGDLIYKIQNVIIIKCVIKTNTKLTSK